MTISSTSSTAAGSSVAPSGSASSSAAAQIEKQIAQLQDQINKETAGKDDAKTKAKLIETYTAQIVLLQIQLEQLQAQARKQATGASTIDSAANTERTSNAASATPKSTFGTSRYLDTTA